MAEVNMKQLAGERAAELIEDGMLVGLGTGSTVFYLVEAVGRRVAEGLSIEAVCTSKATEQQAEGLGIPVRSIDEVSEIDIVIDGVDEIDVDFNAIKGGGGALYREKVVAVLGKKVVWIMDEDKCVCKIGAFSLPVEVARFGAYQAIAKMEALGLKPLLRMREGKPFVTDNGGFIADLQVGAGFDIADTVQKLQGVVGVLEHGLFLNLCQSYVVARRDGTTEIIQNPNLH